LFAVETGYLASITSLSIVAAWFTGIACLAIIAARITTGVRSYTSIT
jgi:hypothetical protein